MRLPGTINTKDPSNFKKCEVVQYTPSAEYTCEELDKVLPRITSKDEEYCKNHYDKTHKVQTDIKVDDRIPDKFKHLVTTNGEVRDIWAGTREDRSTSDYRLGHIMFANGFTREEARSTLVNSSKALERSPVHA